MNTHELLELLGRKQVMADTGLSRGSMSQWATANRIPSPWLKFLKQKYQRKVNWAEYTGVQ